MRRARRLRRRGTRGEVLRRRRPVGSRDGGGGGGVRGRGGIARRFRLLASVGVVSVGTPLGTPDFPFASLRDELPRRLHQRVEIDAVADDVRELRGDARHERRQTIGVVRRPRVRTFGGSISVDVSAAGPRRATDAGAAPGAKRERRLGGGGGEAGGSPPVSAAVAERPRAVVPSHRAEHGDAANAAGDGVFHEAFVRGVSGLVEHDAGDGEFVVECEVSLEERGDGSGGLRGAVDDEEDRGAEPFGDLSGAAALVVVVAVEEGLAALDDGDVGVGGEAGDAREVVLAAQHPPVEVERGAPGGGLVEERVEQVGANLETLHAETALAKRRHQTHREGGLTHASLRAGDDDDLHRRASSSRAKSIRNPSTRLRLTLHLPSSFDREYPRYRGARSPLSRLARAPK